MFELFFQPLPGYNANIISTIVDTQITFKNVAGAIKPI